MASLRADGSKLFVVDAVVVVIVAVVVLLLLLLRSHISLWGSPFQVRFLRA